MMKLWLDWGELLTGLMDRQIKQYETELGRKETEWEMAQQLSEYLAKKQALVDLKKTLAKRYE